MIEAASGPGRPRPPGQGCGLPPGLAEAQQRGVDQVRDGEVRELDHEVVPGHPEIMTLLRVKLC